MGTAISAAESSSLAPGGPLAAAVDRPRAPCSPGQRPERNIGARQTAGQRRLRRSGARGLVAVAAAELLHAPGGVEDARLPGVERVARRGDLDVDDGVGASVLPGDGSLAGRGRPGEEGEVRRAVAEDDRMIVRVDFLLHGYRSSRNSTWRPITGSYLRTTRRSGSFLRLFLVTYVEPVPAVDLSLMTGRSVL